MTMRYLIPTNGVSYYFFSLHPSVLTLPRMSEVPKDVSVLPEAQVSRPVYLAFPAMVAIANLSVQMNAVSEIPILGEHLDDTV